MSALQNFTTKNIRDAIQLVGNTVYLYKIRPEIVKTVYEPLKDSTTRTWFRNKFLSNASSNSMSDDGTYTLEEMGKTIELFITVSYQPDGFSVAFNRSKFKPVTLKRKSKNSEGIVFDYNEAQIVCEDLYHKIKAHAFVIEQEDTLLRNLVLQHYGSTILPALTYVTLSTDEERNQFVLNNFKNTELLGTHTVANDSDKTITAAKLNWETMSVELVSGF
jgi:hypothetical protein